MFVEKRQKIFSILFISYWIILWFSINTSPVNEGLLSTLNSIDFSKSIGKSFGFLRIVLALLCTCLIILYFIYIFFWQTNKINKIYLFIILSFISQLIGLYFNQEKTFDVFNTFLAFLSIGTVCLLALCDQIKVENILKYFFWTSLIILTLVFITILSFKLPEIKNFDFYSLFSPKDSNIFTHDNPRISGLSRTLAILNLFLILYFFSLKQYYFKKILLFFSLSISLLILLMESRGTLLSYFVTLTFITLFLVKKNTIFKIKYFLILIVFPIVLSIFIFNNYTNKESPTKNDKIFNSRIVAAHSSSRLKIWTYVVKNYDYKRVFGYGPQGDRFFLKKSKYINKGNDNSSNILLYTLLSGGLMSIFFWVLAFFEIFKTFIKNRNSFLFNRNNYYLNFSISCIVFFLVRSIIENSFGLFSIDFLMMNLSIVYMLNSFKVKK
jgi:hypothetical protein